MNRPTTPTTTPTTTRLAPSPTGALHLGNARTFLINWAMARHAGWNIVLRIEDLDGPRVKPSVIDLTIDLLRWLGIDWDGNPTLQSSDWSPYEDAMRTLASRGLVYRSELTRSQVEAAAGAPQEGSGEARFPPELRPRLSPTTFNKVGAGWRFATPDGDVIFEDTFAGPQRINPHATIGDFIVWTKRDQPAYQLAVVVDDARQGVTRVVRGDDLLDSAARQLLLYRALGLACEPTYTHLPLVLGPDGKRLAKRHGDTRLDTYRAAGVTAERVRGLVAFWSGFPGPRRPVTAREFLLGLDVNRIPRSPVTFTPEDERWLRSGTA